jgi:hypothetical protein
VPSLNEVKTSVEKLSRSDLKEFRRWFEEYDADEWNRQIEQDVRDGKLDALARKALERLRKGECDEL